MSERLYNLLPPIYRERDADQGWPLRALFSVLETEYQRLRSDTQTLYENWFVETCDDWVLPYIGDLNGVRTLADRQSNIYNQRRHVANTIAYRRSKGLAAILENVAGDVTGWSARVVEFFQLLAWTQNVNHVLPAQGRYVDMRDTVALRGLNGIFDTLAHRPDMRPIGAVGTRLPGSHNLPNVGIFLWRLNSYALEASCPASEAPGQYHFDPGAQDTPLFVNPAPTADIYSQGDVFNRPAPIDPALFAAEPGLFFGPDGSLCVWKDGALVPATSVQGMDLSNWGAPPAGILGVDVVLGRLSFAAGESPRKSLRATYCFGRSADIGGGPYPRDLTASENLFLVSQYAAPGVYTDLSAALAAYAESGTAGVVRILDNSTYALAAVPELSSDLTIEADDGFRPCLILGVASVSVPRSNGITSVTATGAQITFQLNGCLLLGGLAVGGNLNCSINDCTIAPVAGTNSITSAGSSCATLRVVITNSILGPIDLPQYIAGLSITGSALVADPTAPRCIGSSTEKWGPDLQLDSVTILGPVAAGSIRASNVIFQGAVTVQRTSVGFARFCYFAAGSLTPVRYRCAAQDKDPTLRLIFTSTQYTRPGFLQLTARTSPEIASGAEDGSEMGVFRSLYQNRRRANLDLVINEYLPLGLEAGVLYVT